MVANDDQERTVGEQEQPEVLEPEIVNDVDYQRLEEIKEDIKDDEEKQNRFYEKLRKKLSKKMPQDGVMSKVTDYLFLLPDLFMLLSRLLMEPRVDKRTKGFILGILAYTVLPIDLIPDFIPVIGFVDDLIIVVFALDQILRDTDEQVLIDNWSGKPDIILTIRRVMDVVNSAVGQRLLMKIKNVIFRMKE